MKKTTRNEEQTMQERIQKELLAKEIGAALKDFFVGKIEEEKDGLIMTFLNGQKFRLLVSEL